MDDVSVRRISPLLIQTGWRRLDKVPYNILAYIQQEQDLPNRNTLCNSSQVSFGIFFLMSHETSSQIEDGIELPKTYVPVVWKYGLRKPCIPWILIVPASTSQNRLLRKVIRLASGN